MHILRAVAWHDDTLSLCKVVLKSCRSRAFSVLSSCFLRTFLMLSLCYIRTKACAKNVGTKNAQSCQSRAKYLGTKNARSCQSRAKYLGTNFARPCQSHANFVHILRAFALHDVDRFSLNFIEIWPISNFGAFI